VDRFVDRVDAGRQLAAKLATLPKVTDAIVVGLPRGGVPVAFEVALALKLPLDVLVVRKIGVPFQPELAMGAIGEDGVVVVEREVVAAADISPQEFASVEANERVELGRRIEYFRRGRPPLSFAGRSVIIVDDGIATGSTARAACRVARARGAARVVLAVPVAAAQTVKFLGGDADEVVAVIETSALSSVGQWYEQFDATPDEDVVECLDRAGRRDLSAAGAAPGASALIGRDGDVTVDTGSQRLLGHLTVPERAIGVVVFVHGSGSSRLSPRNRAVAASLNERGLATLLFDLLSVDEERDRANVFDIGLLATRLLGATAWLETELGTDVPLGYFGASTGAAAALFAAAEAGSRVAAVVSRGGRVDLADARLGAVRAATLMIVGGADPVVLELNRKAMREMTCESRLEIVEGATHLFEEPGAMHQVTELAGAWFVAHLAPSVRAAS
jgi:putative phosphoribosyl transferase